MSEQPKANKFATLYYRLDGQLHHWTIYGLAEHDTPELLECHLKRWIPKAELVEARLEDASTALPAKDQMLNLDRINRELKIKQIPLDTAVLCLIKYGSAWFTTQELSKQWGDDWNDIPYEHNAGEPYRPHKDDEKWEIIQVKYSCSLETPAEKAWSGSSRYSVEAINSGAVAWLASDGFVNTTTSITAGTSLREFIRIIKSIGGEVYLPIEIPEEGGGQ
jgi:hypothetical protein